MSPRSRLLTCGAAAALLVVAGLAAGQEPATPAAGEIPELPAIEDLSATVDRPLFSRSRRPPQAPPPAPVVAAAPKEIPAEEAPADLNGIVSGPDQTYAILTSRETKEVHHLRKGEKIEEWSLDEIGPRHVVLKRGPGSLRLELFEDKKPDPGAEGLAGQQRLQQQRNAGRRFVPRQQQRQQPQRRQRPNRQPSRRGDDND